MVKIVYDESYNIRLGGLENLSPFDGCKYEKIWHSLNNNFPDLFKFTAQLNRKDFQAVDAKIAKVHDPDYIKKLENPEYIAKILELPSFPFRSHILNFIDLFERHSLFDWPLKLSLNEAILKPMKWAVAGTCKAAKLALEHGIAVNLSGGYHHASKNFGEGFCVFSDIGIAINELKSSLLLPDDNIVIIDLDAHQGNGLERIFFQEQSVHMFDMFNKDIYPQDRSALNKVNLTALGIKHLTDGQEYLSLLKENLPTFLEKIKPIPRIVFFNAGTDVYHHDPLGGLLLTKGQIFKRDQFVFDLLTEKRIPWVMVLSGGYTKDSYSLVSDSISYLIKNAAKSKE